MSQAEVFDGRRTIRRAPASCI